MNLLQKETKLYTHTHTQVRCGELTVHAGHKFCLPPSRRCDVVIFDIVSINQAREADDGERGRVCGGAGGE